MTRRGYHEGFQAPGFFPEEVQLRTVSEGGSLAEAVLQVLQHELGLGGEGCAYVVGGVGVD